MKGDYELFISSSYFETKLTFVNMIMWTDGFGDLTLDIAFDITFAVVFDH